MHIQSRQPFTDMMYNGTPSRQTSDLDTDGGKTHSVVHFTNTLQQTSKQRRKLSGGEGEGEAKDIYAHLEHCIIYSACSEMWRFVSCFMN